MSQQLESGKACNLLKSSLTTAKHVTATGKWQGLQSTEIFSHHCKACQSNWNIFAHIPSLYSFLTLLTVLRVLLTFRVSYVSRVLANIMTESSPLLLEM
jgi:hypothetical protein